jgi:hypothetical protein
MKKSHTYYIRVLPSHLESLTLRHPLLVTMTFEAGEFRAEVPSLQIYAFADKEASAVAEVIEDFTELCSELKGKSVAQLGVSAQSWKRFIDSIIA